MSDVKRVAQKREDSPLVHYTRHATTPLCQSFGFHMLPHLFLTSHICPKCSSKEKKFCVSMSFSSDPTSIGPSFHLVIESPTVLR